MDTMPLTSLPAGALLVVGGDRTVAVPADLADAIRPGDAVLPVLDPASDEVALLHLAAADRAAARSAVDAAARAFTALGEVPDEHVTRFFDAFADRLEDDAAAAPILAANAEDVAAARSRGRSTTRLELTARMRADMVAGLRSWAATPSPRGTVHRTHQHEGWQLEEVVDRLGVVAFVFEGRPNVFADACGVLRGGNTVVFRIGSDALGTARAIVEHALEPALEAAGLPSGAASLVDAPSHAAGWALFSDQRLALAVARGSGPAVHQLSAIAAQAGTPVSAHGTGGAWLVACADADADRFRAAVHRSLDRKVCNTLNTCLIVRDRAPDLVPAFLAAVDRAAADRGTSAKLHVLDRDRDHVPTAWFERRVGISRAAGVVDEPKAETLDQAGLGREWEWEGSPEVTLAVVDDLDEAVGLFNRHAPRFVLSVLSDDPADLDRAFATADAPYVGDGMTRWVDGQYALGTPELGLANWERGRLLARSGILSGDVLRTFRMRMRQSDPDLHR